MKRGLLIVFGLLILPAVFIFPGAAATTFILVTSCLVVVIARVWGLSVTEAATLFFGFHRESHEPEHLLPPTDDDGRMWAAARTIPHLARLTALWLAGSLASHPRYPRDQGPGLETLTLLPVLVALNRIGLMTVSSEPSEKDGAERCACVTAYAESGMAAALVAAACDWDGIIVDPCRPGSDPREQQRLADLYGAHLCDDALTELIIAWRITLIDTVPGSERLWDHLAAFAEDHDHMGAEDV